MNAAFLARMEDVLAVYERAMTRGGTSLFRYHWPAAAIGRVIQKRWYPKLVFVIKIP